MHPSRLFIPSVCLLLFTVLHEISPISACGSDDTSDNADWKTPAEHDAYASGESVLVQFSSNRCTASPAIQLCNYDGGCGEWIWPDFKQGSDSSLAAALQLSNVTNQGYYCLKMKDDSGDCGFSPIFSISPIAASPQDPSVANSSSSVPSEQSSSTLPVATENDGSQSPMTAPPSASSYPPSSDSTSVATSPMNSTPPVATSTPNLLVTRIPPPTVAFAVPLSIVGAILLIAGGVFVRHNRKLSDERAKEVEKLKSELNSMSRASSYTSRRVEKDLEWGFESNNHGLPSYGPNTMPVPLFMPMAEVHDPREREPRRSTRKAYSDYHPSCLQRTAYGYPHDPQSRAHGSRRSNTILSSSSLEATEWRRPSAAPSLNKQSRHEHDDVYDGDTVTGSVIDDYLGSEEQGRPQQLPPKCLLAAPQRLHIRNQTANESDEFQEIDLYDAVANNLRTYHRST